MGPIHYAQLSAMAILAASIVAMLVAGKLAEWRNV
jgi:hypothetical protein